MGFETASDTSEQIHPGDEFYSKLGLPEDFGQGTIPFHGREIQRRDYFFQPDVDPKALHAYQVLSVMDENDENFPRFRDAFLVAAEQYLKSR